MLSQVEYITIYVRIHNGNGCHLRLPSTQTFHQLIKHINLLQLQLPPSYTVIHKGSHVRDYDRTLKELGIDSNSILHIEQTVFPHQMMPKMDVTIAIDNEILVVESSLNESVKQLKLSVYKLTQIHPKHQVLVFNGKKLQNSYNLSHYKILPNSLICLISTAKRNDFSEVLSDYDNVINELIHKDPQLLESALSACQRKTAESKTSLFRSQSIDKKYMNEIVPIQIQIHQNIESGSSVSDCKEFNYDLFKTMGMVPMTLSVDHANFESLRNNLSSKKVLEKKMTFYQEQDWSVEFDQNNSEDNF